MRALFHWLALPADLPDLPGDHDGDHTYSKLLPLFLDELPVRACCQSRFSVYCAKREKHQVSFTALLLLPVGLPFTCQDGARQTASSCNSGIDGRGERGDPANRSAAALFGKAEMGKEAALDAPQDVIRCHNLSPISWL